jgi:hypothetical protein
MCFVPKSPTPYPSPSWQRCEGLSAVFWIALFTCAMSLSLCVMLPPSRGAVELDQTPDLGYRHRRSCGGIGRLIYDSHDQGVLHSDG